MIVCLWVLQQVKLAALKNDCLQVLQQEKLAALKNVCLSLCVAARKTGSAEKEEVAGRVAGTTGRIFSQKTETGFR